MKEVKEIFHSFPCLDRRLLKPYLWGYNLSVQRYGTVNITDKLVSKSYKHDVTSSNDDEQLFTVYGRFIDMYLIIKSSFLTLEGANMASG